MELHKRKVCNSIGCVLYNELNILTVCRPIHDQLSPPFQHFLSVYNDLFCILQAIESAQAAQDIKIRFDSFQQQFQEVRCVYEVFSRVYDVDTLLNTTLMLAFFKVARNETQFALCCIMGFFCGLSFETVALALGPRPQLFKSYPPDKSQSTV